jgi:hypothetical protein
MGRIKKTVPVACTLSQADLGDQAASWHAVLRGSILGLEELSDGFALSVAHSPATAQELRRLASLEGECCGWMRIAVGDGDPISLSIRTENPDGKEIIKLLLPANDSA